MISGICAGMIPAQPRRKKVLVAQPDSAALAMLSNTAVVARADHLEGKRRARKGEMLIALSCGLDPLK